MVSALGFSFFGSKTKSSKQNKVPVESRVNEHWRHGFRSIFNVLREYDISVHESNRFNLFYKDFKNLIVQNNLNERFSELLEGMRDYFEIRSIVQSTEILSNSKEELTSVFGGTRLPSTDINTRARNLQYQLFLASRFYNSGLNARCVEPDFSFEYDGSIYSVAVKRLTSKTQIQKRIREAEQQILLTEYEGFIALSLDRLMPAANPFILTEDPDSVTKATEKLLLGLIKEMFPAKYFEERDKRIKGLILTLGIPSFTPTDLSFGYGLSLQLFPLTEVEAEEEFNRIGKICERLM